MDIFREKLVGGASINLSNLIQLFPSLAVQWQPTVHRLSIDTRPFEQVCRNPGVDMRPCFLGTDFVIKLEADLGHVDPEQCDLICVAILRPQVLPSELAKELLYDISKPLLRENVVKDKSRTYNPETSSSLYKLGPPSFDPLVLGTFTIDPAVVEGKGPLWSKEWCIWVHLFSWDLNFRPTVCRGHVELDLTVHISPWSKASLLLCC
jgi:hypothetical protein